jgi:predicted aspartyl protease
LAWPGDNATLKFHLHRGFLILVSGSIGPLQGLTFVVDTGVSRTIVSSAIADRLGLTGRPDEVFVAGRSQSATRVDLPDLKLGPISSSSLSVLVMDLVALRKAFGKEIDAMVGLDVLRGHCFVVDYRHRRLIFSTVELNASILPFEPGSPYLVVTAKMDGEPVRLLVDTGTNQFSLFANRLPAKLRQPRKSPTVAAGIAGRVDGAFLRDVEVRIGDWRLPKRPLLVVPGEDGFRAYDGHLAVRLLGASRVYFDFENGQLRCEK